MAHPRLIVSKPIPSAMDKKIIIPLAVVVIVAVAVLVAVAVSDGGKDAPVSTETVSVTAYDMSYMIYDPKDPRSQEPAKDISEYLTGEFDFLIKKDQGEVLYCTMDTFIQLFAKDLKEGFGVTSEDEGKASVMTVTNDKGNRVCQIGFDASDMTISETGSLDETLKSNSLKNTLMEQLKFEMKDIVAASRPYLFSFEGYGLDPIERDGKFYYPLDLMSLSVQRADMMRAFVYSSDDKMLFQYAASGQMGAEFINGSDSHATISKIVSSSYSKYANDKDVINPPAYMLEYVRGLFYFLMDNYYGLDSVTGYKSMSEFIKNNRYSDQLVSPDPTERTAAYKIVVALLQDLHTSYTASELLGEDSSIRDSSYVQCMHSDRLVLRDKLSADRDAVLKAEGVEKITDVRYSSDGRTAYFSFDQFGEVQYYHETLTPEERLLDTYYLFVNNLNEIKNHGGVQRVIIDDTVNGGGTVVTMGKILALLSKDNLSRIYFAYENSGIVTELQFSVDSNDDGVYDERDCFGQYFDFYILTSTFSYSCGNALPFMAKYNGVAQVIGTKSGGGEMTVDSRMFPFGIEIGNSSLRHMCFYDYETQTWKGDENGQPVDKEVLTGWYDVDAMSKEIDSMKASS